MIQGVVNAAYEAVVTLSLQGLAGQAQDIEAVVDTRLQRLLDLADYVGDGAGTTFCLHRSGISGQRR